MLFINEQQLFSTAIDCEQVIDNESGNLWNNDLDEVNMTQTWNTRQT